MVVKAAQNSSSPKLNYSVTTKPLLHLTCQRNINFSNSFTSDSPINLYRLSRTTAFFFFFFFLQYRRPLSRCLRKIRGTLRKNVSPVYRVSFTTHRGNYATNFAAFSLAYHHLVQKCPLAIPADKTIMGRFQQMSV